MALSLEADEDKQTMMTAIPAVPPIAVPAMAPPERSEDGGVEVMLGGLGGGVVWLMTGAVEVLPLPGEMLVEAGAVIGDWMRVLLEMPPPATR